MSFYARISLFVCAAVCLWSCALRTPLPAPGPQPTPVTPGDIIVACGQWAIYLGCACALFGGIAKALAPKGTGLSGIADEILIGGVLSIFGGTILYQLGVYIWIVYVVCGVVVAFYAYRYRNRIFAFAKRFNSTRV